jgi:hypothetical protein
MLKDTLTYGGDIEQDMKVQFVAKISTMGKDRFVMIFPKTENKVGKQLRGKYVKAALEEIISTSEGDS